MSSVETGLVPCSCSVCGGARVSRQTRRVHEERDLRQQSSRTRSLARHVQTVAVPNRSPSTQRGALAAPRNVNVGRTHAAVTRNIHRVGSLTPAPPIRSSSSLPPNSSQLHSGTVFERAPSESPSSGDFQPDDRDTDAQTSDSVRLDEYSHARGSPGLLVHSTSSNLHGCPPEARTSNLSRGMDPQPDAPPTAILSGPGRFTSTPTAPLPTDAHLPVPIDYTIPNPALSAVPSIALSAALSTAPATLAAAPSVALSAAPSATSSATPSAPIRSSSTFRTRSAPSIIRDAESRGQEHELRRSTDTFEPIADDDWEHEDRGHEDDPAETDVGDRDNQPPPAASSNKDTDDSFDPFQYSPAPVRAPPTPQEVHPNRAVYMIYLLVLWLHSQFHLAFRACNAVLLVVSLAFRSAGSPINPPMVTTLPTVIAQLDAESSFKVYPVCPTCLKVYPVTTPYDHTCDRCAHPLYHPPPPRTEKHRRNTAAETRRPYLQYPSKSIEEQLATILALPGMEREMESWRNKQRVPGKYVDMFDGDICKTIPGPDGSPFFFPDTEAIVPGELRIGVSLGADWFSYLRSLISASHTSCPISLSIVNLATYLRYRTANLMLAGIIPGPKEPNPDEVQEFLKVLVNELLRLWKDGVIIITPSYPNGRLVRVILVCVVCDKPAAHKVGGFASHSHHFFCTRCWVEQDLKATSASFESNGFRKRTNAEQRRYQAEYKTLSTKAARAQFVKDYATRWCELSRLPYFDLCRMIVVDPMHNLFLGVVKTHFYHIWIQQKVLRKTKELRRFHAILSELSMPAKLGRLPSLIGEPAGGSLTADQWLVFATVVAPIAIPQVWQDYQSENSSEVIPNRTAMISALIEEKRKAAAVAREKAAAARRAVEHMSAGDSSTHQRPQRNRRPTARAMEMDVDPEDNGDNEAVEDDDDVYAPEDRGDSDPEGQRQYTRPKKRRRKAKDRTVDEEQDSATPSHLHQDDPGNFLKLCTALKILVSREITDREIDEADTLLREYCQELVKLYGPAVIRPNHHYATHISECARDYGPLHEFWTFLFERMNKVLKSYKTSNHAAGELETSFFREFHRTVQESRLLGQSTQLTADVDLRSAVEAMYRASADDRGTLQAMSRELDEAREDEGIAFRLSTRSERRSIPNELYYIVLAHLRSRNPDLELHSHIARAPTPTSKPFLSTATFFDHITISNQRYSASTRCIKHAESLVAVRVSGSHDLWVGELEHIFAIDQEPLGLQRFGKVRWHKPINTESIESTVWGQFKQLHVRLWVADTYMSEDDDGPSTLIDLKDIVSHVVRHTAVVGTTECWVTVTLHPPRTGDLH